MSKYRCPSCLNEKNNYMLGAGYNMTLYYSCGKCGHNFVVDVSKEINEADKSQQLAYAE